MILVIHWTQRTVLIKWITERLNPVVVHGEKSIETTVSDCLQRFVRIAHCSNGYGVTKPYRLLKNILTNSLLLSTLIYTIFA
jgi:hypothetical protein